MENGKGLILIVDDDQFDRMELARIVEEQGHEVEPIGDGLHALELLRERPFDAVILDLVIPETDGFTILERMMSDAELKNIPAIVISDQDGLDAAARAVEMGAEDYISKPINPVFLKTRLDLSLQRKKLSELEQAYAQQEVMLQQSDKMATLGKMSAGLAHELNNPAASVQRNVAQLGKAFIELQASQIQIVQLNFHYGQLEQLLNLGDIAIQKAKNPPTFNSLDLSDREAELEDWLGDMGVEPGWEFAETLVYLGDVQDEVEPFMEELNVLQRKEFISWLTNMYTIYRLISEIGMGTERITEIIKALKTYSYMDQAPIQDVDIHDGLDNTLILLRSKLKHGINVHRDYDRSIPHIEAYGVELNQVWTNIIDNAAAAMEGHGDLYIRTGQRDSSVFVEIEDTGPGIPPEVQAKIFDPFFTTKPPGEGTGMGLNISYDIIVKKHGGRFTVKSEPGKTCFLIILPITHAEEKES